MKKVLSFLTVALISLAAIAQAPAFPGAEGHGRYVTGGRGGQVIHVTNLNDKGTGSFRQAVSGSAKKIVVFDVGGVIALASDVTIGANTTILGQTAPAPGITLRYYTVRPNGNNIIMRFIRCRRGQEKDVNDGADAIWCRNLTGIILDHCSFSWSIDEVASFYDNNNFTMQWCTIGESLNNAGHEKGAHGYGGIWGGKLASFHHNLICHVNNRSPRFNGARYEWQGYTSNYEYDKYQWANEVQAENVDFRNCVIYNCGNGCYGGPGGGQINIVNNYYKTGPAATTNRVTQITVGASGNASGHPNLWTMTSRYFIDGNQMNNTANFDGWSNIAYDSGTYTIDGEQWSPDPNHMNGENVTYQKNTDGTDCVRIRLEEAAPTGEVTTHSAAQAYDKVLSYSGASLNQDDVDLRYFTEAKNGTATYSGSVTKKKGRVDLVSDVNGYTEETFGTGSRETGFDTDNDGMPDAWETANGLNPNDASDAFTYTLDAKGWYTNLEVYANSLVQDIIINGNTDAEDAAKEYFPAYKKTDGTTVKAINTIDDDTPTVIIGQTTPISQMEHLDRGVVALPSTSGNGNFLSWRYLGTDYENTLFDVVRNGVAVATNLKVTNFTDANAPSDAEYQVVSKLNGLVTGTSKAVKCWSAVYKQLKLDRPATGAQGGTYSPNDCSVGDVDGDGEYEIFVKWDPDNSKDNSQGGITDNVFIDCYKLDGTKLWRIDLGVNIRAGAHYTQFQVYDYDGDGKAELMCKTAPGSKDGQGNYVNQAATDNNIKAADNETDWRTDDGRINGGHEYLTIFNGQTGTAIHTIAYWPNRNAKAELSEAEGTFNWYGNSGKNDKGTYGNRGERYLAATAYLAGSDQRPSGIFCRGYYTYAYIWAVDFDGQKLTTRWLHRSDSKTSYSVVDADGKASTYDGNTCYSGLGRYTMYANGNHNMSIADVDGDGKDEIIWGSAALDDDGKMLYAVGFGHGDAIHLADLDPDRPGLELFDVHEEKGDYAWDLHDAATGEIIWKGGPSGADNGRGMAGDIVANSRGYEFWSAYGGEEGTTTRIQNPFSAQTGKQVASTKPSMNFRIYWDGDLQDELLDGTAISKYGGSTLGVGSTPIANLGSPASCNSTKATPCLSADIFGDWREELILWDSSDNATLNIYTTITPTDYRVPTLMHDHTYRMGICWQNTAYNQPPHLGYYLPDYIDGKITIAEPQPTNVMGDVNSDGYITAQDASLVLQYVAGKTSLSIVQLIAADVNGDGNITAQDASLILQYVAGKKTSW